MRIASAIAFVRRRASPPLGEPLEPVDLGLLHPVRLLDRLIGEHLRHGGVDPALRQRGSHLRLLERRV